MEKTWKRSDLPLAYSDVIPSEDWQNDELPGLILKQN